MEERIHGRFKIRIFNNCCILFTVILATLCVYLSFFGIERYNSLCTATEDYITCRNAAVKLDDASDELTKDAYLTVATGEEKYAENYVEKVDAVWSMKQRLDEFTATLESSDRAVELLKKGCQVSINLMQREYYAMRLMVEATHADLAQWPEAIRAVNLKAQDEALSDAKKLDLAKTMLIDEEYANAKTEIAGYAEAARVVLTDEIVEQQQRGSGIFANIFWGIIACGLVFAAIMLLNSVIIERGIVRPLVKYSKDIQQGEALKLRGVHELQMIAKTYNSVYAENAERERLMRYQAEHDPLTDLLNRRSFDYILELYEKDERGIALLLVDVDIFKSYNDTYGHAAGDAILKRVADTLKDTFRSVDSVCRIGGDEFAVIMVGMKREQSHIIAKKLDKIKQQLAVAKDEIPEISLSIGVAFSEDARQEETLFQEADSALYYIKAHGRDGYQFYPLPPA